jgi:hypothetical protein
MGKGGTKFEGDAIGVRGKVKVGLSGKEMRRNMVRRAREGGFGADAAAAATAAAAAAAAAAVCDTASAAHALRCSASKG